MNTNESGNNSEDEEIDLVEIWQKLKPFAIRYRYWLTITPVLAILFGLALAKLATPQWEAVSLIKIGKVSKSELVEPADAVIARIGSPELASLVLAGAAVPVSGRSQNLYRKSLTARLTKPADTVEVRVRGYSKEEVSRLAALLVKLIEESHASAVADAKKRLAGKLANAGKIQQRAKAIAAKFHNGTSSDSSLAELAALYFIDETDSRAALASADLAAVLPTAATSVEVADAPVYPKTKVWLSLAGILGLFFGVAVALALNAVNRVNLSK